MKSEKHSDLSPPSGNHQLRHRSVNKSPAAQAAGKLIRPAGVVILIMAAYALGYASQQPIFSQPAADVLAHSDFSGLQCSDAVSTGGVRRTILERVFGSRSPWEDFPPPHAAAILHKEWSKGWGSNAAVFEHLINQVQPKTIIEVGTFLGASATHMAKLTGNLGLKTQIICIDDFRGWPGWYDDEKSLKLVNGDSLLLYQFMQNVASANATESIIYMPFSASTALRALCEWGIYGDLVEIDAAHDFHSAWVDINNAYRVLRPGGVLFGHDIVWEGVKRAVHLFARIHGFQVRVDGEHWILY
ncbi:hypothetical protein M569_03595 [Genlisea aurea]|uniref:Uncharacterized protein n=1 Tax=Genlisea aurea TaxID=192259 RepID=S8CUW6_9LAMI|nr:hypothetical protein M569_03595 [Genlisea aurea]